MNLIGLMSKQNAKKKGVIVLGKIPPPFYGPAIATQIILESALSEEFNLVHIDTRLNTRMDTMGKGSLKKLWLSVQIYLRYFPQLFKNDLQLVWVPIAQERSALLKDAIFIVLAFLFRKKVVIHLRGSTLLNWYQSETPRIQNFFANIFRKVDGAIVLGESLRYIFEPFLPADKIFVVPNGANYNVLKVKDKGKDDRLFRLVYLSNLQANKGVKNVIEALRLMPEKLKDVLRLDLYGAWSDTEFEKQCVKIIQENKLPIYINSPISGTDKMNALVRSDVFVFPPDAPEGHPWAIVEAMACGLPIITTDQGAIIESVKDGVNGFIVPTQSPNIIAECIVQLFEDRDLLKNMGKASKEAYEARFTEQVMVSNLSHVFNKLLATD